MVVFFLSADRPIVKSYELGPQGELIKHPYPFVYEVTSHEEHPKNLQEFSTLIQKYAKKGSCLVKGVLGRQLINESRAGATDPNSLTDWVCLDLDGIEGFQSVDLFLEAIGCGDTEYIVQWSSSMGIENKVGFRCHIFMRLDQPTHPQLLKHWLQDLNLRVLDSQLELTKTGNSLRWPLDITTCQNDKLLYIAPPKLGPGIKDPFPSNKRISYVKKKRQLLTLPYPIPTRDALRDRIDKKVQELRAAAGLPKRKSTKYKFMGSVEYMANPDSAVITEMKTERGFVYFNLNGGDSWAYYHPEDNPTFIYNFKGEPTYRTEDLLPEYWAKLQAQAASYQPNSQGLIYLAFRDFRTSNYFNGWYDTNTGRLELAMAKSESQLRQFMKQHGQPLGDFIPDWNLVWDPHNPNVVDPKKKELNTFQPSPYALIKNLPRVTIIPPTINKVISHVLGHDAATIDHFINWLACIVQYQNRTGTAWVWQGTQGTGKGVLFHQIITPLLGEQNVVSKRMEELESEFTGFMENKFVVFIDEIEAGKSLYHSKVTAKLKNLIVEPMISIRKMYTPAYMAPNYANMIFASNKATSVEIAPDDRRFNVGPYQTQPIQLTATEIDVDIPSELEAFYAYLKQYKADPDRARKPLVNAARATLIDIGRTAIDSVADAILTGNLEFLWEHLSTADKAKGMNALQMMRYQPFRDLVVDLINTLDTKLTRDDLYAIFEWCIGNMPQSPHKFTALLKHHRIHLTQIWKNNRNVRGISIPGWQVDPNWLAQARAEIAAGAI
ncbi:MAG: hypothetical protein KatS3mg015_2643 [Fimbriimonadales bacterium]|nr:MAG: hypothetical protein KatS3mg015_2643 [Fimbriimonadales bacterium]